MRPEELKELMIACEKDFRMPIPQMEDYLGCGNDKEIWWAGRNSGLLESSALVYKLLTHIEELESRISRWIPVTERLPENEPTMTHLVWTGNGKSFEATYFSEGFHIYNGESWLKVNATHWMPLLKGPKEEEI